MTFYKWSQTAASNASADGTINWAEGQAPSSVNDSARGMMAAAAKYRDDVNGSLRATGTSSAYVLASNQGFDTLAHMVNSELTFLCPADNAAGVTLNIDGLGALPINGVDGIALPPGIMLSGGIYTVTVFGGEIILHAFNGNPYNVPVGGMLLYTGATVPNSNFVFPLGQTLNRAAYAALFAITGTTYGVGDGSTTFNVINMGGRVPAGREASASSLTATYFGGNSTTLGATGGLESHTLTTAQLAVTTPSGTISAVTPSGTISAVTPSGSISAVTPTGSVSGSSSGSDTILVNGVGAQNLQGGTTGYGWSNNPTMKAISAALSWAGSFAVNAVTPTFSGNAVTPTFSGNAVTPTFTGASFGSGSAHNNVQPTIICNYILRII